MLVYIFLNQIVFKKVKEKKVDTSFPQGQRIYQGMHELQLPN